MATEALETKMDLVAKEIELTKLMASNDLKTRIDFIKQIEQMLLKHSDNRSDAFQLNDYLTIWKGLFYFMRTFDKPVPQENVTEKISYLIHSCISYRGKILFLDAFFLTISDDWKSIRQHHIDKCMMLVRHCLRQLLFTFVNCDWNLQYLNTFSEVLYRALKSFTLGSHLQVIFLEELTKVSKGKVPSEALIIILDSFFHYISELNGFMLIREVTQNVFKSHLPQSSDLETLEAKFQDLQKMVNSSNSFNDKLVGGDIANYDSYEINDNTLDPQAINEIVEIPHIKFNPKDITKVLNKYLTEVYFTRKCLLELTKLIQFYNNLGDYILPNMPKDLRLKSEVLKQKKKKKLSKMVKDGVKKLEMVGSRIKKSSLKVYDHKSLRKLDKMDKIVVDRRQFGNSTWKVIHFDNVNTLTENFNLNRSWIASKETKIDCTKTVGINDDKPPLMVPAGFNVEILETPEKTSTKIQKKVSLTPNFKSITVDSSLKELNKMGEIVVERGKIGNSTWKVINFDNVNTLTENFNLNRSWIVSKETKTDCTNTVGIKDDKPPLIVPAGFNVDILENSEETSTKIQKKVSLTANFKSLTVDSSLKELNKMGEIVVERGKIGNSTWKVINFDNVNTLTENYNLNRSWIVSKETKIDFTNTVGTNDDKPRLNVPPGFNVEILETPEETPTKIQEKVSLTPNFKSSTVDSSLKELNKMGEIVVERGKIGNSMWKVINFDNVNTLTENYNLNRSWIVSKETKIDFTNTVGTNDDKPRLNVPPGFNVEILETPEETPTKTQEKVSLTPNFKSSTDDSSLNELNKVGEIVVKRGKIGNSTWKVINFDNVNTLTENFNLNRSWIVSKETKTGCTNIVGINDDKPPLMVPAGFNVEILETPEEIPTKIEEKVSLIPNFKTLTVDSSSKETNSNERTSKSQTPKINKELNKKNIIKQNSRFIKIGMLNGINASNDNSWSISAEYRGSVSKNIKNSIELEKTVQSVNASPLNNKSVTQNNKIEEKNQIDDLVIFKVKLCSDEININLSQNDSWSMCSDEKLKSNKCKSLVSNTANKPNEKSIQKSNSPSDKICSPNIVNTGHYNIWSVSAENNGSATKKLKKSNKSSKVDKYISLASIITPHKNLEIPKSPTFEPRTLRQRTTIIPMNTLDGQNEGTPKRKVKETSAKKVLQEHMEAIAGNKHGKEKKSISLTSVITPHKNLEIPKSPTFELRTLRRRTIIIPMNTPDGQNEGTPKRKVKETSAKKVLQEQMEAIAGNKPDKVEKSISLTSVITPHKNLEIPKSPTFELRTLRRRTIIIPMNTPDGQNEGTPKRKVKETSATKVLQKRKKTIDGEVINILKPAGISNKALEKMRYETFEDGFGSLRKSPRLLIKANSTKKRVEYRY